MVERAIRGDDLALSALYREFSVRFMPCIFRHIPDRHEAQEVLHDAFLKFLKPLRSGEFTWMGTAQAYAYFDKVLRSSISDYFRRKKPADEPLPREAEQYLEELLFDPCDPAGEEVERSHREACLRNAFKEGKERLTESEMKIFNAYYLLIQIPGSEKWPAHRKTAFLRQRSGLKPSAFYPAHSRMKGKLAQVLKEYGLLAEG